MFAPLIIITPVQSMTLVMNIIYSKLILHEIYNMKDYICSIVIIISIIFILCFSPSNINNHITLHIITNISSLVYNSIYFFALISLLLYVIYNIFKNKDLKNNKILKVVMPGLAGMYFAFALSFYRLGGDYIIHLFNNLNIKDLIIMGAS